jgi:hypothetical protein
VRIFPSVVFATPLENLWGCKNSFAIAIWAPFREVYTRLQPLFRLAAQTTEVERQRAANQRELAQQVGSTMRSPEIALLERTRWHISLPLQHIFASEQNEQRVLLGKGSSTTAAYCWTGHKPGSGLSDQTPATLGVFASWDRF